MKPSFRPSARRPQLTPPDLGSPRAQRALCAGCGVAAVAACIGLCAHMALFTDAGIPALLETARAQALSADDGLGYTVTPPQSDPEEAPPSTDAAPDTPPAAEAELLDDADPDNPAQPVEEAPAQTPASPPDDAQDTFEGPTGPDTTRAEATGMPVSGGVSAEPMDALLEALAKHHGARSAAPVVFADAATGHVAYDC